MKPKLPAPSATFLIVLCFVASGLLRIADNGGAIAKEVAEASGALIGSDQMAETECPAPIEPKALLEDLLAREANLDALEERLMNREQVLRVAKLRIEDQLASLADAEERLASTLATADQAAEKDLQRLTTVYENMKPKQAAEIFETMDATFAAGFLARMRPDAAAGVLSNLENNTAYAISVIMAGRNSNVPTQ